MKTPLQAAPVNRADRATNAMAHGVTPALFGMDIGSLLGRAAKGALAGALG